MFKYIIYLIIRQTESINQSIRQNQLIISLCQSNTSECQVPGGDVTGDNGQLSSHLRCQPQLQYAAAPMADLLLNW